jgi:hypothetical protein
MGCPTLDLNQNIGNPTWNPGTINGGQTATISLGSAVRLAPRLLS